MSIGTIPELLKAGADDAPALSAPSGRPLTYRDLRTLVADVTASLASQGIGAGDRVAIVLDNGPEMAAAFLSVGSAATAAPLNPSYRAEEFEFYLTDLGAKLLIVAAGKDTPAIGIAQKLSVPVARLTAHPARGAGTFSLQFEDSSDTHQPVRAAKPDDIALVLHTSGTTSRPKIVPLAHKNIAASAANIRKTLALTPNDRGLVIMPLFHIHGLIAALSAPLSAGGEVSCSPGFNALKFFSWLDDVKPTWYTGVPTMHQAILLRAPGNPEIVRNHRLRFIRSSSSALPPTVIAELERVFGVPVIEAYGMTEATHQMASNPLGGARKPGTVGPSGGPEIRVVDEKGTTVPRGQTGEIVIRGPNVMTAYENNPKANAEAFYDGWFRTGDQGVLDENGYLTLVARIKELINRGGEKISPREIDEVLLTHPAIAEAVCFGVPHGTWGEEVAAAVVLREGATATDADLLAFCKERLADFKRPKQIHITQAIPRTATGKIQRGAVAKAYSQA